MTIEYCFEDNNFDYDVLDHVVKHELYHYLLDNWTQEECLDFMFANDNEQIDLLSYFEEDIKELFESEAEDSYYEQRRVDNKLS